MENAMKTLLRCFSLLILLIYSLIVYYIHSLVHSKMWYFSWWDGLWHETEWRDWVCLQVSGEAGIRLQGECVADIARTGGPTGQRPKSKQLFQIVSAWSTVFQHASEFHQKPEAGKVWLFYFRLLGTFWGITAAEVVSPLWVVFCVLGKIGKQYFSILGKVSWTGKAWWQFAAANGSVLPPGLSFAPCVRCECLGFAFVRTYLRRVGRSCRNSSRGFLPRGLLGLLFRHF